MVHYSTLGKIGNWGSGGTPLSSQSEYYGGDIPWLITEDLNDGMVTKSKRTITELGLNNSSAVLLEPGTLLIAMYGSIGKLGITAIECATNQAIAFCNCDSKLVETKYVFYYLLYSRQNLEKLGKGVTQQNISQTVIKAYPIPLPSLDAQRIIAAILDKAERLRRLRRYALELSDSYLQSVFLEMFGDPVANPTGWKKRTLPQIIDPDRPITYGILKPGPEISNGIPYVRVVDIRNNRILVDQVRHTSQKIAQRYKRSILKPNDLLISIRGHVGRLAKVPGSLDGANITQDTARLAPIPELCDVDYLMGCLNTRQMQGYLANQIKGVAVRGINLGDLKILQVPLPPLPLQKSYARVVERFERLRSQQREALRQAEHLFISLLHYLFGNQL